MRMTDVPVPYQDLLAKIATDSKPLSAWRDEIDRAAKAGDIEFLYRGGVKGGKRYLTERQLQAYLSTAYSARNTNTANAVREALNRKR